MRKNNSSNEKEISNNELARMIQEGFLDMGEKINKVEKRLNAIEGDLIKKVDKTDHNTLVYRVERMEKKFV